MEKIKHPTDEKIPQCFQGLLWWSFGEESRLVLCIEHNRYFDSVRDKEKFGIHFQEYIFEQGCILHSPYRVL